MGGSLFSLKFSSFSCEKRIERGRLFAGTDLANKKLFAGTVLVRKDGFWDNGSYTYVCVRAIFDPPPPIQGKIWRTQFFGGWGRTFSTPQREKRKIFEFGPLKIWFLCFFTKIFNFWILHPNGSKYSEIFEATLWFLTQGPLFFKFSPKNFQIFDFSSKRPKIL